MIKKYLKICHNQNKELVSLGLVFDTFGNVSQRVDKNHFTIKPSGINLTKINKSNYPIININSGKVVEGKMKPSSDTPTHLILYKKFSEIGGIVHTHSLYATIWSQSNKEIPILGTTHADYFNDKILITRKLTSNQILKNYEMNTGLAICERIKKYKDNINIIPGILVRGHGPFTWGRNSAEAVKKAEALEYISNIAFKTILLNPRAKLDKAIIDKHFNRKNGAKKYYGQ